MQSTGSYIRASNLCPGIDARILGTFMSQAGRVENVRLSYDSNGQFLGEGVVQFANPADAQNAIASLNNSSLLGISVVLTTDDGNLHDNSVECYKCGARGHIARECSEKEVCYKCGGIGHVAKDCPSPDVENRTCYFCQKSGHLAKDCPSEEGKGCFRCGAKGHIAKDCTEPDAEEDRECFNCKKKGHLIKDCPEKEGGDDRSCYKCGKVGHIARDCTGPERRPCYNCGGTGHLAIDCPEASTQTMRACYVCGQPGHLSADCSTSRQASNSANKKQCTRGMNCKFMLTGSCNFRHTGAELAHARAQMENRRPSQSGRAPFSMQPMSSFAGRQSYSGNFGMQQARPWGPQNVPFMQQSQPRGWTQGNGALSYGGAGAASYNVTQNSFNASQSSGFGTASQFAPRPMFNSNPYGSVPSAPGTQYPTANAYTTSSPLPNTMHPQLAGMAPQPGNYAYNSQQVKRGFDGTEDQSKKARQFYGSF